MRSLAHPRRGRREVAQAARRTPARIYTVGLQTRAYNAETLRELAGATRDPGTGRPTKRERRALDRLHRDHDI